MQTIKNKIEDPIEVNREMVKLLYLEGGFKYE